MKNWKNQFPSEQLYNVHVYLLLHLYGYRFSSHGIRVSYLYFPSSSQVGNNNYAIAFITVVTCIKKLSFSISVPSRHRLSLLQLRDMEKRENEIAKNNLESHIFEFTDFMYTDEAATYSSEEERETITNSLRTASEWLEEDGYNEETNVYKQKLKELKRLSRPVVRRKQEASKRPELFQRLRNSINVSVDFLGRMKNISELEIFTDVEAKTLTDESIAAQVGRGCVLCV